ncbi:unnamed protein product [Protopolystoma xenopodis]|uniref:mitogen-activated protein kinase kinase n=1 Tax=Protopolystoma xenopodis TaxID=117903 RepID=A0A448WI07_9PLAT|nr:unnamed protein product [Protopolystoma xenopodis]
MNKRLKKLDGMRLAFDFATTTKRPDGCFPVAVSSINPVPAGLACSTEVSLNGKRITISVKDLDGIRSLGRGQFGAVEEMIERQTGCVFAVKRIAITTDNPERPKLLNDLNVSMRSSKCPYVVTSYGALSHEDMRISRF